MRKLQKVRVVLEKGKQTKKETIGDAKKVIDSSAELVLQESKVALARETKASKNGVKIVEIWEDKGEVKKPAKKAETKK